MFEVGPMGLRTRELLRERTGALVEEACAWAVGLSDAPHLVRRHGRAVPSGSTLGSRAGTGLPLASDEDVPLELTEAEPGSFQDALGALAPDGGTWAERFEEQVLVPFVLDTCVQAAERAREAEPEAWLELLDEVGEDEDADLAAVVRAAEWEAPLRVEAERLVLDALATAPLVEVEREGLPLSVVRAAEAETARWAPVPEPDPDPVEDELAGALFLADLALRDAGLPLPVPLQEAGPALEVLLDHGLQPEEVLSLLPYLPVSPSTAQELAGLIDEHLGGAG